MDKLDVFVFGIRGFPNVQGGVEKHCEELYPRLARTNCDITVITRMSYIPEEKRFSEWKGVKFVYLWAPRRKNLETIVHSLLSSVICILKRPCIIHIHNIGPALVIPLLRLLGIKTVLTYHSINYEHQKWSRFAKFILKLGEFCGIKFADKVIVVSRATKSFLEKKYIRKDLKFIPNGVSLPEIVSAGATLKRYNLEPKKYIFIACRFTPEKGLHDLIAAYSKIENPKFKLVISGDVDYETEYSKKIRDIARKTKGVVLTGFVSGEHLQELYSNAGLFVLPSYHEGLPIVLLEAMSYNLPLLVSDIAQNRDISLPEFRFFLPGEIDLLTAKIVDLFEKGISEREKAQQYKILQVKYNWDKIAQQTFEVYKSMVNSV